MGPIRQTRKIRLKQAPNTNVQRNASNPFSNPAGGEPWPSTSRLRRPPPGKSKKHASINPPQQNSPLTLSQNRRWIAANRPNATTATAPHCRSEPARHCRRAQGQGRQDSAVRVPVVDLTPEQIGRRGDRRQSQEHDRGQHGRRADHDPVGPGGVVGVLLASGQARVEVILDRRPGLQSAGRSRSAARSPR